MAKEAAACPGGAPPPSSSSSSSCTTRCDGSTSVSAGLGALKDLGDVCGCSPPAPAVRFQHERPNVNAQPAGRRGCRGASAATLTWGVVWVVVLRHGDGLSAPRQETCGVPSDDGHMLQSVAESGVRVLWDVPCRALTLWHGHRAVQAGRRHGLRVAKVRRRATRGHTLRANKSVEAIALRKTASLLAMWCRGGARTRRWDGRRVVPSGLVACEARDCLKLCCS